MSTLFEHRTTTLPLITSRFVNETFPGWSRIIEACIDMLAAHGGAMDALGVYGGIRFSRRQCDLPREESLLRNTAGESRMGRRMRLLAAWRALGLSWKELVGTLRTHRAEKTPLWIARFNYTCQPSPRNMRKYKHIDYLFSDYLP
jgi:hypothetical protein